MEPHLPTDRPHGAPGTVSLVIPLLNESSVLQALVSEIETFRASRPHIHRIILVDDGSTDGTAEKVRRLTEHRPGYTLVVFSRNFGHQVAVTAGLACVKSDAAVVLDADLQDPLEVIDRMIEKWREGYDVVYGIRTRRDGESGFKRVTALLFYRLFRWLTDMEMPLDSGDFRLLSRPVVEAYRQIQEQQPFVRGLITWLGFNQTGIPYVRAPRAAGRSKYSVRRMTRLAVDSLTSFSDKPLRLAVRLGLLISLGALIGGIAWAIVAKYVLQTAITGWASLLVVIAFFGGVQLFFLGLVGSYLSRVYEEVKRRPRYVVRQMWDSTGLDARNSDSSGEAQGRTSTEHRGQTSVE